MGMPRKPHEFEARYDEVEPDAMDTFFSMKRSDIKKNRIYVRDICVHCGMIVERDEDGSS